jgi:hypothetical protein
MGRQSKYPYHKWTDGEAHTLTQFEDFDCSIAAIRTRLHEYGRAHGYEVRTIATSDTITVVFFRD